MGHSWLRQHIALEPGESLTGAGPIAAGDTARWIIGDTESGSGVARRVHVLVKPTRADITTNLVITTDRRTYMVELRSGEKPYMPAVAWAYPQPTGGGRQATPATPVIPAVARARTIPAGPGPTTRMIPPSAVAATKTWAARLTARRGQDA